MDDVWRIYDGIPPEWAGNRQRFIGEETYLKTILSKLGRSARILDLGCGAGEPIARFLIERGYALTGIDAAPAMIAICRKRFPAAEWIEHDMRTLKLSRRFDVVIRLGQLLSLTTCRSAGHVRRLCKSRYGLRLSPLHQRPGRGHAKRRLAWPRTLSCESQSSGISQPSEPASLRCTSVSSRRPAMRIAHGLGRAIHRMIFSTFDKLGLRAYSGFRLNV